ncbi:MAG TPA: c-type cytochrome biogenesis protein CcmI [Pseudolabrys sp.]|nr:c-type cytochrome biogenesis protein CcmI [Pseudolabrys sp.]
MILWLILASMTVAAIVAVIFPLVGNNAAAGSGSDVVVYRDQLDEIERDLTTGLIGKTEAEAARIEISRRLLGAADAAAATPTVSSAAPALWRRRAIAIVSLVLLPLGAGGLYLRLGSPGLASESAAVQRKIAADQRASVESLVSKVEAHLRSNPDDGHGWEVVAPVYMQLGRYTDSVNAWRNSLRILGESADRLANLGEALMAEANGVVTADAKDAFVRAVTLDGTTVSARFYLGVAAEQDGDREKAVKIWRDLIADAPADAHWVGDVRAALARVEGPAPASPPGLTTAKIAAAVKGPPEQQDASIRGMVEGLAARLRQDGSDLDGWVKLVRSYKVLGDADKAQAAVADAQKAFAEDPDKRQRLDAALKELDAGQNPATAAASAAAPSAPGAAAPEHEGETIRNMVDRLAERLKKSGDNPERWLMLVRSYMTLGEMDKANAATEDARRALSADPAKLKFFNDAMQRIKAEATPGPAPAGAAPAAGDAQPPAADNEMIRGMVARLAERLKQDGSDFDGWMQLVRSYVVLGDRDKAKIAAADARHAIGDDADKRRRFDDFIKTLGLDG